MMASGLGKGKRPIKGTLAPAAQPSLDLAFVRAKRASDLTANPAQLSRGCF